MAFDIVKRSWQNLSGFMSIRDSVAPSFGRGIAFATGFFVTLCSTFSREMVSDVSVTYLLNAVHDLNPWSFARIETEIR